MGLSVIIPVRNGMDDLALSVGAILSSSTPPEEILIVDDGSREPLPGIVQHPLCRVIRTDDNQGSFHARNLAARQAIGGILVFIDSDVCVTSDTLAALQGRLKEDEGLSAVFGRYDEDPAGASLISQYRNLLHSFMHQSSSAAAHTFWTGCGAIRRAVFLRFNGFALDRLYLRDVELGVRLSQAGHCILLDNGIAVKHRKQWTLGSMIRTDVFYRAANWTEICLRSGHLPNDMNVRLSERICVILVYLLGFSLLAAIFGGGLALFGSAAFLFAAYLFASRGMLAFLSRARGWRFTLRAIPLHMLYHLCCGAGLLVGVAQWLSRRSR